MRHKKTNLENINDFRNEVKISSRIKIEYQNFLIRFL